ncbi:autotransporter outer membrane beta-barrel domain-containing protein [Pantoea sp. BAV 3049]|uniref:autotransporter outer membrane beta-barrel domain-containing protein n=1 Tax=Pantoea sp. BAV 3049 TaxID=2654188 RepID=UPI00351B147B
MSLMTPLALAIGLIYAPLSTAATPVDTSSALDGGYDSLVIIGAHDTLQSPDILLGISNINITRYSVLTLDGFTFGLGKDQQDEAGTGYRIDTSSELEIKTTSDLIFKSHLSDSGVIKVDTKGTTFNFDSNNAGDGFTGTVALNNTHFELSDINTQALSKAKLRVENGSITHVAEGEQKIGGLVFAGGTVKFDGVTPGGTTSSGMVQANGMNLLGRGTVQVDTTSVSNVRPEADTQSSILEQDDTGEMIKLGNSDTQVWGGGGNLVLKDENGNVISDAVAHDFTQNGEVVANGTYDYRLTGGEDSDGLYINYGLTQVELLTSGENALSLDAEGHTADAADLSAKIIGGGDLAVDSQQGQTVTLSNMDNSYTGQTDVRSGNLAMLNDNVLGKTSELKLAENTGFDMRGHSQTIGELTAAAGSLTDLNSGHLTIAEGGTSLGELAGDGLLTLAGGTLDVTSANNNLRATVAILQGATANVDNTRGLGSGNIDDAGLINVDNAAGVLYNKISNNGEVALHGSDVVLAGDNSGFSGTFAIDHASMLTASEQRQLGSATVDDSGTLLLNNASDWTLANVVTGSGGLTKAGAGILTLNDNAQWSGTTEIAQGEVILGSAAAPLTLASNQVNIDAAGRLSGFGGVAGNIDNRGEMIVGSQDATTTAETFSVGGNLQNSGNVWIGSSNQPVGNHLVVNGDYAGNGGHLHLNTALGGDSSATDKLTVNGNTSGTTGVSVMNAGGTGAQTLNGIEIIHVTGSSDGEFTQDGRIVAGAYDYSLVRGQQDNSGNWYLISHKPDPDPQPDPQPGPAPQPDIRPEAGSYTANLAAANMLFTTRLHDRLGETQYVDAFTGETKETGMWIRHEGGHNNWRDSSGQLKTQSNRYVMQIGGDVARWSADRLDRGHLGLMAGYGHNSSNTRSSVTHYGSGGSVNGYSAGAYATWYANDESHQGVYVDSWAQYNWFNNHVKGDDIQGEAYKSKGFTASLETGYTRKTGEFRGSHGSLNEWFIQPQAQIVWMGVKADDHREFNGTGVHGEGDGNIQTRLGMRTFLKGHHAMDNDKERTFQPFVEVNWLHNSRYFGTKMDGIGIHQTGTRDQGEVKTGLEGQIAPQLDVWGNVGVLIGDKGYNDAASMVGVRYNFK